MLGRGLWRDPQPLRVGLFAATLIQQWPIASTSNAFAIELGGLSFVLLGFGLGDREAPRMRIWIALGAFYGLTAVAMAALAAHAIPADVLPMVRDGIQMQGWHALALLFAGLWSAPRRHRLAHLAGAAFALGTPMFCGAIYCLALAGLRLPMVAPTGGTLLMLGWLLLTLSALRHRT